MKFNLLLATVALSAVMAVPSQMNKPSQDSLALMTNGAPAKKEAAPKPKKSGGVGAKIDLKSYASPANYRKLLLDLKLDAKIPGLTDELKDSLVEQVVSSIRGVIVGFCNEKIPPVYAENKDFIDELVGDVADFLAKRPERIPKLTELAVAHLKKNPDGLSYLKTNFEFLKEIFVGPLAEIEAGIFAKIKERQPSVDQQIKDSAKAIHEVELFPEEYYQRFVSY
ncbi:hypothetical protein K502DRAFT_360201 [Neoconidiobolus thromboides FSU 785]|nr:hypothetical protein K502DRAFT_360201 [Neoconidiobolus thromboides FSU 785]